MELHGQSARRWWTLAVASIASFMLLLDVAIVSVALPDIQVDLGATLSDLQWVVDSYVLALAAATLIAGALADRLGRKRVFLAGLVVFMLASLAAGLATSAVELNVARAAQGLGGAAMFGTVLALIAAEFAPSQRKVPLGIWGATVGVAVAVGPLVGGVLVESLGWEWIFFVNLPIGVVTFLLGAVVLRESRDVTPGRIDVPGVLTFGGALFLLVYALLQGNASGWGSGVIVGSLAAGLALLAGFVLIELRSANPMLDVRMFKVPAFTGASLAVLALAASVFSVLLYVVLYLQNVLGYSPFEAGLRLLPLTLMAFVFSPVSARLSERVPLRAIVGVGLVLAGIGLLISAGLGATSDWTALLPGLLLAGAGTGLVNPAVAEAALGVVPAARVATGAAINNTFRQVGVAVGVAALGAFLQYRVDGKLHELLPAEIAGQDGLAEVVSSGAVGAAAAAAPPEFATQTAEAAHVAFVHGLNGLFIVSAALAFAGAVAAAALLRQRDLEQDEPSVVPGEPEPVAA